MSGLLPKADIRQRIEHVCFVPIRTLVGLAAIDIEDMAGDE